MTKVIYNDYPWEEIIPAVIELVKEGHDVYQKWTCEHCGSRQSMDEANKFYTEGMCEECKKITNIQKNGCNYMLHIMLNNKHVTNEPGPKLHTVIYTIPGEGLQWQFFECMANDQDHAEEQCKNAYPACDVLWINEGTSRKMEI